MTTALIGLDYIVDIMSADSASARSADEAQRRNVIENFNRAHRLADEREWLTALIVVGFASNYRDVPPKSPVFSRIKGSGALQLSTPGTAFHPDLQVTGEEVVITKPRISGFYGTRLDPTLRAAGVTRVIIAGVSTTWAVEATAREAHDRDYEVLILEDACAATTADDHQRSITTLRGFARIVTTEELEGLE